MNTFDIEKQPPFGENPKRDPMGEIGPAVHEADSPATLDVDGSTHPKSDQQRFDDEGGVANMVELTYDEAESRFGRLDQDFKRYRDENRNQPEAWWTEPKVAARHSLQEMRETLRSVNPNAPGAWGEIRAKVATALIDLETSYRLNIREF